MSATFAPLRSEFDGQIITPEDPTYDSARQLFSGVFDHRPAVIIRPADTAEATRVVTLARETGLPLAIRSGGHSAAGHSMSDGGIVLDLANLTAFEIDPARGTAWAGAGMTAGAYTQAAGGHGLATGFGDTGSVGIGGVTLGGGVGYLARKHGLTIDDLLGAEIITADGHLRRIDADHEPDLFWAIRGGGGNFGVVTRLQFRLHPLRTVVGGMLVLPATPVTISTFIAEAEAAPDELSTIANVMPAPPMPFLPAEAHGRPVILALICYSGDPDAADRVLAPFRALATPLSDQLDVIGYPQMFPPEDGNYRPKAVGHTMFLDTVDEDVAATILHHLHAGDAPMRVAQLRVLGGAVARVPVDATAYAHRRSRVMANLAAMYDTGEEKAVRQAWLGGFSKAMAQDDHGAYVNFLGDDGPARLREAYPGATWDRLVHVKNRYDPGNLFRLNHNIPPQGA